jgi:hypothetical protein
MGGQVQLRHAREREVKETTAIRFTWGPTGRPPDKKMRLEGRNKEARAEGQFEGWKERGRI